MLAHLPHKDRRGSPVVNRPSTDLLHHFVLSYAEQGQYLEWVKAVVPGQFLEWDKAVITWTRFRMG